MVENELQFVDWAEFQEMVPSIVQLEISRLERLIEQLQDETDLHNAVVKARFELEQFATRLQDAEKDDLEGTCAPHLEAALLTISMISTDREEEAAETLRYVADRLEHVHDRMEMIY